MQVQVLPFLLICENTLIKVSALYLKVVINEASWYRIIFGIRKGNRHLNVYILVIPILSLCKHF